MTGAEVKAIREALGEALGRRVSVQDLGEMMGLSTDNASKSIRRWEEDGPTGPGEVALRYLAQGLPGFRGDAPEWSLQRHFHGPMEYLTRWWWPRFLGSIDGGRLHSIRWIDDPGDQREATLAAACAAFRLRVAG